MTRNNTFLNKAQGWGNIWQEDFVMGEVVDLDVITTLDLDPDRMLSNLVGELDKAIVIGYDKDGNFFFSSSIANGPDVLWLLETAKLELMMVEKD